RVLRKEIFAKNSLRFALACEAPLFKCADLPALWINGNSSSWGAAARGAGSSSALEHRARLAILKAAVDYALAHPDGPPEFRMSEDGKSFFFQGLTYHVLPKTFHDGIAWLREQPNFAVRDLLAAVPVGMGRVLPP
ncbi:hypothetical protein, partial [Streptomyces sp. NPDC102437]|uniref:hypothetical protein n=1 Tax=Streptomyces sp. NPDC102437 TaxID=3366175 RepID=UPI0038086D15